MVRYEAKITGKKGDQFISADIIIYDDDDNTLGMIYITDESQFNELKTTVENFSTTYVSKTELTNILSNAGGTTVINATKLSGKTLSEIITQITDEVNSTQSSNLPTNHATEQTTYGVGTGSKYGHVKTINNLTSSNYQDGYALSAYQGRVLNDKIDSASNSTAVSNLQTQVNNLESKLKKIQGLSVKMGRIYTDNNGNTVDDSYSSASIEINSAFYKNNPNNIGIGIRVEDPFSTGRSLKQSVKVFLQYVNSNSVNLRVHEVTTDSNGKGKIGITWNTNKHLVMATAIVPGGDDTYNATDSKVIYYGSTSELTSLKNNGVEN